MRTLLFMASLLALTSRSQAAESRLFGDWNGGRPRLEDAGVQLSLGYTSEAAHNFSGGQAELTCYTDQWLVGATFALERLWGWQGATLRVTYTERNGDDLGADAEIGNAMLIQEVYGRGQTLHLTQFWLEQSLLEGRLLWKVGRVTVGEDFAAFSCDFQNLTFCGAQPGNLVGDYWLNWPTSVWGTRLRMTDAEFAAQAGVYQVNPQYVDDAWARENGWRLSFPSGTTGALIPLEFAWAPRPAGMAGNYKLGAWFSTAGADDVFEDVNGDPLVLTGLPPRWRGSRRGVYINVQQQVSGTTGEAGASLFLNATQADRNTTTYDRQVSAGLVYAGPFGRRRDMLALALGATHVNSKLAEAARLNNENQPSSPLPVRDYEYVGEAFYGWSPIGWLRMRPNVQYIVNPGGASTNDDALVLGLKSDLAF